MRGLKSLAGMGVVTIAAVSAAPAATIDGTRDAEYGSALAVQTVETQFGDNFSEWNAGYAVISGGKLSLMLTGNLEANFNKLEIFIDSKAGGQSMFDSSGNDGANVMDGLVFDTGFTADYHVIARRGNNGFNDVFDLDFADLGAQSASGYFNLFSNQNFGSATTGTGVNAVGIGVAYDGSNNAGILGGTNAADQTAAQAVTTGLELSISLADLGYVGGPIHIMVGQNAGNHNFWSNQFLGGLTPPQGNLGGDGAGTFTGEGAIDMNTFSGDQFFTVVPEPASLGLIGFAGLALLARRRRD